MSLSRCWQKDASCEGLVVHGFEGMVIMAHKIPWCMAASWRQYYAHWGGGRETPPDTLATFVDFQLTLCSLDDRLSILQPFIYSKTSESITPLRRCCKYLYGIARCKLPYRFPQKAAFSKGQRVNIRVNLNIEFRLPIWVGEVPGHLELCLITFYGEVRKVRTKLFESVKYQRTDAKFTL